MYANPYPIFASRYSANPYFWIENTIQNPVIGIRWGLSRGVLSDVVIVLSIAPEEGPAAGGQTVIIRGSGFQTGATVKFGATPATSVVVINSTTISAVTPAHVAGVVNVTVQNPNLAIFVLVNGYTYV